MIPEQIFGAPFGGDTSLFRKSQVMNKKVGIREAFHFEDEKKQVPSWNARNRTSSNWKRVIEVAELPIFFFLELLANTQSIFKKIHLSPKKWKSCGWGFKGVWGLFHKTVHLTSCMRFLTRWAPSLVINGVILTINGLIHVSHWVLFQPLTSGAMNQNTLASKPVILGGLPHLSWNPPTSTLPTGDTRHDPKHAAASPTTPGKRPSGDFSVPAFD